MIDLTSAIAGAAAAGGILVFAGTWLFATKAELAAAIAKHDRDERDRNEAMVKRLFDKIDEMAKEIVAARLEIASLPKYSRGQGVDLGGPKP